MRLPDVATTRQLTAILAGDEVGYRREGRSKSPHSGKARPPLAQIVRPLLSARKGREIRWTAAGFLAEFDSGLDAVLCALDIHQRLHERAAHRGARRDRVRLGVHVGHVQARRGGLSGDALVVASRIESLAGPGEVCVSAQVFDLVRDRLPNRFEKFSAARLHGPRMPFDVYRVRLPWDPPGPSLPESAPIRLAVLPFEDVSPDPKDDYFADGLTQEVITSVSKIRGLRVLARSSVREYTNPRKPLPQIGAELDVATVLKGSVRKSLDRLRVTVELTDVRTQQPLWETRYDRELADVFAIQTEVAERTAAALRLELVGFDRESVRKRPTSSLSAYDAFLKGLHALHRSTAEGYSASLGYFEEAIRQDPQFSLAYAHLATTLLILAGERIAPSDAFPRAKGLVRRALELDPNSADAHTAQGNLALQQDQNWPVAEAEFQTALALNPSDAHARYWYGVLLRALGRFDEAIRELEAVLELDPLWELPRYVLIGAYSNAGDLGSAVALAAEERRRRPGDPIPHVWLGLAYARAGKIDLARREAGLASGPIPENYRIRRAILWAFLGDPREARQLLREFQAAAGTRYVRPTVLASLQCVLGEKKRALDLLERDLKEGRMLWLDYHGRAFDPIRGTPRFRAILRALRLPSGGADAS